MAKQFPKEIIGYIAMFLNRNSIGNLCCTSKSINRFLKLKVELFQRWPTFTLQINATDRNEMVHIIKSPDDTKLCIVNRRYGKSGSMCVYDIKTGPLCVINVNDHFMPVFSPSSDIIIAGSINQNERGVIIGRISSTGNTRANKVCMRYVIHWQNYFNEYAITGATYINQHEVLISHTSGGDNPRLSCRHIYNFTIDIDPLRKQSIMVSNLHQCPFTVPFDEPYQPDDEISVDVSHHYRCTAVDIHNKRHYPRTEVNVRNSQTKQIIFYEHTLMGYRRTIIPMNPRLFVQPGLMLSLAFSSQSSSFIGIANGISNGRIITFFDEPISHMMNNGPFQNFSFDLNYFGAYGPPKIWYYDGDLLVYSIHEKPTNEINHRSTEEERQLFIWKAARLSAPKALRVRGKVSDDIKECIMEDERRRGYITYERYYEPCILDGHLSEGWCSIIWNIILNNKKYK